MRAMRQLDAPSARQRRWVTIRIPSWRSPARRGLVLSPDGAAACGAVA
jgi:hypothetical protein